MRKTERDSKVQQKRAVEPNKERQYCSITLKLLLQQNFNYLTVGGKTLLTVCFIVE
jgi:hypothetical protein